MKGRGEREKEIYTWKVVKISWLTLCSEIHRWKDFVLNAINLYL